MKRSHVLGALLLCAPLGIAVTAAQTSSQGAGDRSAPAAHRALTATVTPGAFCSFLPPEPGGNIAGSESNAVVFCNKPSSQAPNANIFPSGFIKTAHFAKGSGFVQVTGRIDRRAYGLSASDGGGQYDSNGAPPGGRVSGAKKFVNLVEPDREHFCIRACTDPSKCNTGESTEGCEVVIPGNYQ
jgi:hypothetical protein